jgi:diacylglycerol O-acyltransferase
MLRLSGTDSVMLTAETPAGHYHIGGLAIIESDGNPRATLQRIAEETERRLPLAPKFMWKLRSVPFGLDRPVWVDDENFDISRHVHFVTLPSPSGRREVADFVGRVMATKLDRRYPLWHLYLVDGLSHNRVALLLKYHHCMGDGVSGASLAALLFDAEPHPKSPPRATSAEPKAGPAASWASLLASAIPTVAQTPMRLGRYGLTVAQRLVTVATYESGGADLHKFTNAPRTSFNGRTGPRRAFGFSSVSLSDMHAVTKEYGVKINDVALAVCAGALRNYLLANGEQIDAPLVAGVPVSRRGSGERTMDNRIAAMLVKIPTDIADPVQRLQRTQDNTQVTKAMYRAIHTHPIQSIGEVAPPAVLDLAFRALDRMHLSSHGLNLGNIIITNIPGPPFELFCGGGRLVGLYPSSVIIEPTGLNITLFTSGDRMDFGLLSDPDLVPDPFLIADGIPVALRDLLDATGLGKPTPVADAFPAPRIPASRSPAPHKVR